MTTRLTARCLLSLAPLVLLACSATGKISIGDDGSPLTSAPEPAPAPAPGPTPAPTPEPAPKPSPRCTTSAIEILDPATSGGYQVSTARPRVSPANVEVHLIGVYEARADHSFDNHPRGVANVAVDRPGHHVLVLSSYEPIDFTVTAKGDASIDKVILTGYGKHTASVPPGTVVETDATPYESCYEWGSSGCNQLSGHLDAIGLPVTDFAGCYRATSFVIHDDAAECREPPPAPQTWIKYPFSSDRAQSACAGGERWVRYEPKYTKWVGAELCSATKYKLFLGEERNGAFHEIGDFAGHGQDHCELANPNFTLPNEDEITSGTCSTCAVTMGSWERPGPVPVYSRARFGEQFSLGLWPEYNLYTSTSYQCGVAIGQ